MKKFFFFGLLFFIVSVSRAQVVSLSKAEFSKLKSLTNTDHDAKKHWEDLLGSANEALLATPNPADTILTEGILVGDPRKTKTRASLEDMQKVYALAFTYKITGEPQYFEKASEFLSAWATRNHPQGNPINDTNLDRIIFAYDLIKEELTTTVNSAVIAWLQKVALAEKRSFDHAVERGGSTYFNNWNSHRIKVVAEIAWAINDERLKVWTVNTYKDQIEKNLKADGSSYDFHERDALHYHVYDVDPLMVAAMIMDRDKSLAFDAYHQKSVTGSSLSGSVDWLLPYFNGEQEHAEFVNSKTAFDRKRAANGEKGYIAGTLFNPNEARTSIALADFWDSKMLSFYQKQASTKSTYPTWQFVLNKVKK